MNQRLSVFQISGQKPVLAGAAPGRNVLSKLIRAAQASSEPTPVFLDFSRIRSATASFLREVILGFRDYCLNSRLPLYPVVANANADILEELSIVLEVHGDAVAICKLADNGNVTAVKVLGSLEETQQITLDAVFKHGEVDALTLSGKLDESNTVGATAWNNRLALLAQKGLVIEAKKGRGKTYRPVLELK